MPESGRGAQRSPRLETHPTSLRAHVPVGMSHIPFPERFYLACTFCDQCVPLPRPHATRHPQILFTLFPRSPPDLLTPVPAQNPGLLRVPTRSARTPRGGSTRCTSRPRKVRASTRARTRSIRGTASFDSGTRHRRSPGTRTRLCATRPRTRPWRATSPPSRWRTRTGGT